VEIWKPVRMLSSNNRAEREEDGIEVSGVEVPLPMGGEERPFGVPLSVAGNLHSAKNVGGDTFSGSRDQLSRRGCSVLIASARTHIFYS